MTARKIKYPPFVSRTHLAPSPKIFGCLIYSSSISKTNPRSLLSPYISHRSLLYSLYTYLPLPPALYLFLLALSPRVAFQLSVCLPWELGGGGESRRARSGVKEKCREEKGFRRPAATAPDWPSARSLTLTYTRIYMYTACVCPAAAAADDYRFSKRELREREREIERERESRNYLSSESFFLSRTGFALCSFSREPRRMMCRGGESLHTHTHTGPKERDRERWIWKSISARASSFFLSRRSIMTTRARASESCLYMRNGFMTILFFFFYSRVRGRSYIYKRASIWTFKERGGGGRGRSSGG